MLTASLVAAACSAEEPRPSAGSTGTAPASAAGTVAPADAAALEALGEQLLAETGATGGIVALSTAGASPTIVTVGAQATIDGTQGAPMDPAALLHVASVTKSYVAALALVLADEGVVDLDAPISTWIDWPDGDRITLRHLLTHTSGVGRFGDGESPSPFLELVARGEPVTIDEVLAAAREVPPLAEPGGTTRYGNLNYALAGAALAAAAATPIDELLLDRVFGPAGLEGTAYPPSSPQPPQRWTAPPVGLYEPDPGVEPLATSVIPLDAWRTALGPASGSVSTVEDLLAWADQLFRRRTLDGVDLAPMTEIGAGGYGLGVIGIGPTGDCVFDGCPPDATFDRLALNGDFPGASTRVLFDPATDTTLVVYLNRNALDLDEALIGFLDGR
ncbi:MAG: beta-lactamase family protein [Acidimicrobiales bacterium]|nr:beta-lactamase family protein [Acidimicrobiales bacterium]